MLNMEPKHNGAPGKNGVGMAGSGHSASLAQEAARNLAQIDAAIADLASAPAQRRRGRPKANRAAIARSLVAMASLGIPTVTGLIDRLTHDATLRKQCGWQNAWEIPKPATFSRARGEIAERLPDAAQSYLPGIGRQIALPDSETDVIPDSDAAFGFDPLLSMLYRSVSSMINSKERDLTLPQLAILLISYQGDRQPSVRSLADELDLFPPDVARALVQLERWHLIKRKTDLQDRRRNVVLHSVEGRQFLNEMLAPALDDSDQAA